MHRVLAWREYWTPSENSRCDTYYENYCIVSCPKSPAFGSCATYLSNNEHIITRKTEQWISTSLEMKGGCQLKPRQPVSWKFKNFTLIMPPSQELGQRPVRPLLYHSLRLYGCICVDLAREKAWDLALLCAPLQRHTMTVYNYNTQQKCTNLYLLCLIQALFESTTSTEGGLHVTNTVQNWDWCTNAVLLLYICLWTR
jgi:hypothetical protein